MVQPLSETATVDPGPAPVVIVYNPDLDVTNDVPEPRIGTYTFQIVATDSEGEEERLYFVFSEVSSSIGTPTVPPFPTPTGGIVVGNCLITADPADPDPGEDYTVVVQVPQPFTTGDTVSGSVSGTDGFQENVSGTIDATGEARLSPQIPGAVAGVEDTITITTPSQCAGSAVLTF
ncbi:MAG: hypothetical protein NW237_09635 [Cyanobacteriota bacterium]|nr:hypothetical protein [Cyanobacteriota bacterium]